PVRSQPAEPQPGTHEVGDGSEAIGMSLRSLTDTVGEFGSNSVLAELPECGSIPHAGTDRPTCGILPHSGSLAKPESGARRIRQWYRPTRMGEAGGTPALPGAPYVCTGEARGKPVPIRKRIN